METWTIHTEIFHTFDKYLQESYGIKTWNRPQLFFFQTISVLRNIRDLLPSVLLLWRLLSSWIWRFIFGYIFIKVSKEPAALFFKVAVILLLIIILYPCALRGHGRPRGKAVKKMGLLHEIEQLTSRPWRLLKDILVVYTFLVQKL